MKKTVSLILSLVFALSLFTPALAAVAPGYGNYKHVFIIGIDGAGSIFDKVDTPNFDRIFKENAFTHTAKTEYVTVSAQNWGSILCGVDYQTHGFDNDNTGKNERGSDSDNNSIFYYVRKAMPDAKLASFCNWNNINKGIIENDIDVKKVHRATDPLVTDAVVRYFEQGNAPALMFVQLDSVDHAGHAYGGFAEGYYKSVEKADEYLGMMYDAIDAQGLMKDSLFILVADHGHTDDAHAGGVATNSHGGQTVEESTVVLAVAGHSVNTVQLSEDTRNRDVAAIALWALGIEQPEHFTASVPDELFGVSMEKDVAPNPMNGMEKIWHDFLYFFVRMVNILVGLFD